MTPEPSLSETITPPPPVSAKLIGLSAAALCGGGALLLAALWSPDPPVQPVHPPGMKVGEHEITLSQGAPQWNALKLAKVTAARPAFG